MKLFRHIISVVLLVSCATLAIAQEAHHERKVIKGFSGGMMVHSGYQFGGDNPLGVNISSPTFGMGGCAELHFTKHFRAD